MFIAYPLAIFCTKFDCHDNSWHWHVIVTKEDIFKLLQISWWCLKSEKKFKQKPKEKKEKKGKEKDATCH